MKYVSLIFLLSVVTNSWAADPAAGQKKAATCYACHGPQGVSANPVWPNLAGQKESYIFKQLMAFHDGVRQDPLMTSVAKMLNEADMHDLAAYFATLKAAQ